MSRAGLRRLLWNRNTLDDSVSADENDRRYWEAHRANQVDPFILPPAGGVIPPEAHSDHYITHEPLNDVDTSSGGDSRRSNRKRIVSTPYPSAASLPRTGQAPHIQPITNLSPQSSSAGVVPNFTHSRQPANLSENSPWPPSGTGWVNGGAVATHRTASSMGPVIPNFPRSSGRRQKNRKTRSSTGESGSASSTSISSHSSDRRRRSRKNPMPAPPRDIARDRARELHEAEQAVNAAKKVREAAHANAVATVEADAYRRAGIQVAPIPNTAAVSLSSQASLLPGVQYSAPFASSSSHLGHGQPMYNHSVSERHNSQPVFTYGNIGKSKPSKGLSALFRRKSAPPKPLLKDVFPQPQNMPPSNVPPWNGYSFVPPPVQDPSKPLILMAGVPPPEGYRAVAFGPVQQSQQGPAPTPRNVPDIPMPPERTDVPVDEDPVIPNLGGSKHHARKPTLHETTGMGPIIADPAQVAYIPTGANPSMVHVADPTEAGGQHFPWSGDIEWPEQRLRPKKRSLMAHLKDWTNVSELSNHPDSITAKAVYSNMGTHPAAMDLMKRKRSQSKEKLDLLEDDDDTTGGHRQASYDQLTRGRRPSISFATTEGGGSGSRSKLKPVYFSEKRGHDLYPFCLNSEHPISWGGATGATARHWYESGKFEVAGYGLGTDGMENDARPSESIKNRGTTRGFMRLLTNADKERTRKEAVELTRAATDESRIVLVAPDIDVLASLSNQFKSQGRERSDWDAVWRPKLYEILYLKFTQHESLRKKLLETHPRPIVFRNFDKFLGDGLDGSGANELGEALVHVRGILIDQVSSTT